MKTLGYGGLQDESHGFEMIVKAENFFFAGVLRYYKTGAIHKREILILIVFENTPGLLVNGRGNPL